MVMKCEKLDILKKLDNVLYVNTTRYANLRNNTFIDKKFILHIKHIDDWDILWKFFCLIKQSFFYGHQKCMFSVIISRRGEVLFCKTKIG